MTAYNFTLVPTTPPYIAGHPIRVSAYYTLGGALGNGDTITATGMIPPGGVQVLDVMVYHPPLDTNASPTGTYKVGDSLSSGSARYISGAVMGANLASGVQIRNSSNVAPSATAGIGYTYSTNENSSGTDIILTVTNALATAATTGTIVLEITYLCVGNI